MSTKDYDADALRKSFQMIGLDYAAPSPTNPRKSFPENEMNELVESIKAHGLLQPILVRLWPLSYPQPGPLTTYEIVAGERRWRAARLAGLTMIEAKCRELSDLEVLEIQIIENLQRADLHPLEEAEGYERIMATHAYTVEQLGEKIGKSRSYIFGRLKLLALDDDARRLFRSGLLNPSTALLVARVPTTALRAKAIKEITTPAYNGDIPSVREAHRILKQRFMLKLADAPFPLGAYNLIPTAGACIECPHRTGNAPDLFDDIDSPDVCTDPDCFVAKKIAHRDREAEMAKATGVTVILGDEAKKIAPNGTESYNTIRGYTNLSAKCYEDPERRTFSEILGYTPDAVLLEDTYKNTLIQVLPNNVIAEKLLAAGVKMREEESAKGNAKVEAKLALERATRQRMFEMLRENVEVLASEGGGFAFPVQAELFQALVLRLWGRGDFDLHARIANLWATSGKNNTERIERFAATIPGMNEVECWQLATDLLFCSSTVVASEWDLDRGGKQLIAFASRFDIDESETRKFVQDELKAKEKEAKPAKKTAKKAKNQPAAEAPHPLKAAQAGELTAETTGPNFVFTSGAAEFMKEPSDTRRFSVTEAAQAGEQNPESETPPADAGLEVMVEKTSPRFNQVRYVHPENADLTWTGRGRQPKWVTGWLASESNTLEMLTPAEEKPSSASVEANTKPSVENDRSTPDDLKVGDCVKIRSTCKNWRMASAEAVIKTVIRPGVYQATYGPMICDVAALVDTEIAEVFPAGHAPSWAAKALSSASDEANAKPTPTEPPFKKYQPSNSSEGEAFFDDWCRRCTKDKAMSEGLDPDQCDDDEKCEIIGDSMLYRLDSPSYPSEWRYDQAGDPVCTAFAAVGDPPVTPRCVATVDMFQEGSA